MREARKQLTPQEWEARVQDVLAGVPPAKDTPNLSAEEWTYLRRRFCEAGMRANGWTRTDDEDRAKAQDALDHAWGGLTQEEADSIANYRGGYEWK